LPEPLPAFGLIALATANPTPAPTMLITPVIINSSGNKLCEVASSETS
jgi:hypothetical protein